METQSEAMGPAGVSGNETIDRFIGVGAVSSAFTVCLIRLLYFVESCAVNLPFDDLWDSLNPLFWDAGPWSSFLYQHGPPRMGLGGLIEWYLYNATHWDVRAVAWAAVVILASTTIVALVISCRLRGRISWADSAIPLVLLSPIHWESMTLTPSLAPMILPLLLVFLLAYAWRSATSVTRAFTIGLLGSIGLFTGYGICNTPITIGLTLLLWFRAKDGERKMERGQAITILFCLGIGMAVFSHGYHWSPGVPGWIFPVRNWWDYPRFCALMFSNLLGYRSISPATVISGAALLCFTFGAFAWATIEIWQKRASPRAKVVWALTGSSLVYATLTSIGRLPTNIEAAFMWRYVTLMTPAVCGLAIASEECLHSRGAIARICFMFCWIALAVIIWSDFIPEQSGASIARAKRSWIASYLKTSDIAAANIESNFWVYFPAPTSQRIAERLHFLEERRLSFFWNSDQVSVKVFPPPIPSEK